MTDTTPQITQPNPFEFKAGFVKVDADYMLYVEKTDDQYKRKEADIKEFIKNISKRKNTIKLNELKISNKNEEYTIKIRDKELKIEFDFKSIETDVKCWTNLQTVIKQFLVNKVTVLAYNYLQTQFRALTEVQKGITKKSMNMIKAERLTMFDFDKTDTLFDCIKEEGKFEEVRDNYIDKRFLHLRSNFQHFHDAILYYLRLYRYSLKDKKAAELNKRNGKKIVMMTEGKDVDESSDEKIYERLRILDDWQAFCEHAGMTTAIERNKFLKELHELKEGSTIPAMTLLKEDGCDTLEFDPNFISYKLKKKDVTNSNLIYVPTDKGRYMNDIEVYVEPTYLQSILDISAKDHGGYAHYPYPLQRILKQVFEDGEKHTQLKAFCIKHEFKRITGEKWSKGYRDIYDEIFTDIHFKMTNSHHWEGEPCLLLVLNESKIREYAKRVYPRSIKRSGRFARSEAIEFIRTGLEVIRLATGDKNKDLLRILHVEYTNPAIQIYIKKLPKEQCQSLEKNLSIG